MESDESELQQLLSMGFPADLASQALAATGGHSALKATDWILTSSNSSSSPNPPNPNPNPNPCFLNPNPNQNPSPSQAKIDRFFHFPSKISKPQQSTQKRQDQPSQSQSQLLPRKRQREEEQIIHHKPLSERMRPRTIDEVVGQDHLLANKSSLIRSAIDSNRLPSLILWGPPGTGKTSIARAIVETSPNSSYNFISLSAVTCGVKDVRDAVDQARKSKLNNNNSNTNMKKRTVLFVDEVHRFNKSQQDSFLPVIEDGSIVFMGATTENPSFHLITPLLSRCRVLTLNPLQPHHVSTLLCRAAADSDKGLAQSIALPRGFSSVGVKVNEDAIEFLSDNCDGDARVALNALEISAITASAAASTSGSNSDTCTAKIEEASNIVGPTLSVTITLEEAKKALESKHLSYDKAGENHYNLISALHKSMRGSDADASIYWLARMIEGGEDPLYIARRLIQFASEDVGLAEPAALVQAVACYQACHFLGVPECSINLAQCVCYLALAPKSIAVYQALNAARKVVRESVGQNEGVPLHLRNAPTKLMKDLGYGKGYIYPPGQQSSSAQTYLPPSLEGYKFLDFKNGPNRRG